MLLLGSWEEMASFPVPSAPLFASAPTWSSPLANTSSPINLSQLTVNDELTWDNGTSFPEPCIDCIADTARKYKALTWLCGGLSFFASLGLMAVWNDKASKIPFASSGCHWWIF